TAHLLLHALHLPLPAVASVTAHVSAPDRVGEDRETNRPPDDEAEDHQDDPARMHEPQRRSAPAITRVVVSAGSGGHRKVSGVNVNYIYIPRRAPRLCQGRSTLRTRCRGSARSECVREMGHGSKKWRPVFEKDCAQAQRNPEIAMAPSPLDTSA